MSAGVATWWVFLCAVSALNILAWSWSALTLESRQPRLDRETYASRRLQLLLSAGYVFGCAFRSAFPVFDVPRVCLVDSWLSSAVIGRSVATLAEMCFVAQWALVLREVSRAAGSRLGLGVSAALLPLIAIAELHSWHAVLTTSNFGHVIEELIWGLSAALVVASVLAMRSRCDVSLRPLLALVCVGGAGYVAYMFLIDVPMYWARWLSDEASGRSYATLGEGLRDAAQCALVSRRWEVWKSEVVWMSLYFSVAVWLSIALVHSPAARRRLGAA